LQEILNYGWHAWQSGPLRRSEAALACDEPVPVVARPRDDNRLHDPVFAHAARQLVDGLLIECLPRLIWIQRNAIERYLRQGGCRLGLLRDQCAEATAECLFLIHAMTLSARRMNSLARLTYASLPRDRMS